MRIKNLLFLLFLGVAVVWIGCVLSMRPRLGPVHVFLLQTAPVFLSEEVAVEKAFATLVAEGNNQEHWQTTRFDQPGSKAPDGSPDRYLVRYQTTYGRVSFTHGIQMRTYEVSLQGSSVVCRVFRGL